MQSMYLKKKEEDAQQPLVKVANDNMAVNFQNTANNGNHYYNCQFIISGDKDKSNTVAEDIDKIVTKEEEENQPQVAESVDTGTAR